MRERRPVVLVTGAAGGLGEACVRLLVAQGFDVLAAARRLPDARRLAREVGQGVVPLALDVSRPASVRAAARTVARRCGQRGLAGLVHAVGVGWSAPLELAPTADLREHFEVNVLGVHAATQALLPLLRRGRGRVLMLSSGASLLPVPFLGAYRASKLALEALAEAWQLELEGQGVQVVLVQPGEMATGLWEKVRQRTDEARRRAPPRLRALYDARWAAFRKVLQDVGQQAPPPDEVARAVVDALVAEAPPTRVDFGAAAALEPVLRLQERERNARVLRAWGL